MEGIFNLNLDMANCNIPLIILNSSFYLSYLIFSGQLKKLHAEFWRNFSCVSNSCSGLIVAFHRNILVVMHTNLFVM